MAIESTLISDQLNLPENCQVFVDFAFSVCFYFNILNILIHFFLKKKKKSLEINIEKNKIMKFISLISIFQNINEKKQEEIINKLTSFFSMCPSKKNEIECLLNFALMIPKNKFSTQFSNLILPSLKKSLTVCDLIENQEERIEYFVDIYSVYSELYCFKNSMVFFFFYQ